MNLLNWVAIFSVKSLDELYHLEEFCKIIVNSILTHSRLINDNEKENVAMGIIVNVFKMCLLRY
jgi:hypothetical protein